MNLNAFIAAALSTHYQKKVLIRAQTPVLGGDINQTFHLQTNTGSFFLKVNEGKGKDMFEKELAGLQLLRQTNTIKIPAPVLHGKFENKIFLVTEFVPRGKEAGNFWEIFARQLAALHKTTSPQFGLPADNYIGALPQPNNVTGSWSAFYAAQRILPLVRLAFNQQKLNKNEVALAENLCNRFENLFPQEKSSLLHGDLWSGNFMADENGAPVIYDPAVYYGCREMDIGMSLLFGGFHPDFYTYYQAAFPLQPNWEARVPLCQLYPLLVHLILFGGQYYTGVAKIVAHYR